MLGVCLSIGQEVPRKILVRVPPEYPTILKNKDIVGIVRVRVVVSPSGIVRSTELVGGNPIFGEAASAEARLPLCSMVFLNARCWEPKT
jgi:hypothetical protein